MLDAALIERALEKTGKSKGGLARAIEARLKDLEQIVYVLRKTYRLIKFAWPALIAVAAYFLGTNLGGN